jgi:hypothetical protein
VLANNRYGLEAPTTAQEKVTPDRMREIMLEAGIGNNEQRERWARELAELRMSHDGAASEKQEMVWAADRKRGSCG